MVDYTKHMKVLRDRFLPLTEVKVELPPLQEDCTCIKSGLQIFNAPVSYCSACNNRGFVETKIYHTVMAVLVDSASEAASGKNKLDVGNSGDFLNQGYTIHADYSDCLIVDSTAALVGIQEGKTCFEVTKHVTINDVPYLVISADKSPMLSQYRVNIKRVN